VSRLAAVLYLVALVLLPWATVPRFPWLHEHAQWSDAVFAAAALVWALARAREGGWPKPSLFHLGLAVYLGAAALSLAHADPRPPAGLAKLLGMAMLVTLSVVTADLLPRLGAAAVARAVAATSLLTSVAAVVGVGLWEAGVSTFLVGTYGDLQPGAYARAQAALIHPNLLASFCVFGYGVASREDAALPPWLRRLTIAGLAVASLLTLSRGLLALGLAVLVRHADSAPRRRRAALAAAFLVAVVLTLSWLNLKIDPTRPLAAHLDDAPSPRRQALVSSFATLLAHPLLGTGPGTSPGRRDGAPFDAHCTPLNVAATLGLPALAGFLLVPLAAWRARPRPTDRATWGMLAAFALEGLGHDVEDFRHLWIAFGLAAAPSRERATLPRG
jgi:hypothetical protein